MEQVISDERAEQCPEGSRLCGQQPRRLRCIERSRERIAVAAEAVAELAAVGAKRGCERRAQEERVAQLGRGRRERNGSRGEGVVPAVMAKREMGGATGADPGAERLGGGLFAKPEHQVGAELVPPVGAQRGLVAADDAGVGAEPRGALRKDRRSEPFAEFKQRLRLNGGELAGARDDGHRSRLFEQRAGCGERRSGEGRTCRKERERGRELERQRSLERGEATVGVERFAEGQVEVHRARLRTERGGERLACEQDGLCDQVGAAVGRRERLAGPADKGCEDAGLRHGLRGAAVAEFGRPIGAQEQERQATRIGLGHSGQPVCDGAARGADERHGLTLCLGGAERGEGGYPLVVEGVDLQPQACRPERERCGA